MDKLKIKVEDLEKTKAEKLKCQCRLCYKPFKSEPCLERHMMKVHNEKISQFDGFNDNVLGDDLTNIFETSGENDALDSENEDLCKHILMLSA